MNSVPPHPNGPLSPFAPEGKQFLATQNQQLLQGDPQAPGAIANLLLDPLIQRLIQRFHGHESVNQEMLSDAVTDALLHYLDHPGTYRPEKGASLAAFLSLAAYRNVLDRIDARIRRSNHEQTQDPEDPDQLILPEKHPDELDPNLQSLKAQLSPTAWELLMLHTSKVQAPEPYVDLLQLHALPGPEQAEFIARAIASLLKKVHRWKKAHT